MITTKIILSTLIFFTLLSDANAQEPVKENYKKIVYAYWGSGWGGQKSARDNGIVVQTNAKSVVAFATQSTWFASSFSSYGSPVDQTTSKAWSICYGRIARGRLGHSIMMVGPSLVKATNYDYHNWPEEVSSVGLLLQGTVMPSWKFLGVGASVFVNINGAFSYGGFTLNLALGRVNYKDVSP